MKPETYSMWWVPKRRTWRQRLRARLAQPQNRVSAAARARVRAASTEGDLTVGSRIPWRKWARMERDATLGWPVNAIRFYRERFTIWTAEPGDVLRSVIRQQYATVIRVRPDGLTLRVVNEEAMDQGATITAIERVDRMALGWQPVRRGGGLP